MQNSNKPSNSDDAVRASYVAALIGEIDDQMDEDLEDDLVTGSMLPPPIPPEYTGDRRVFEPGDSPDRRSLRMLTRNLWKQTCARVGCGNRITAVYRSKLGLAPSQPEKEQKDAAKMLKTLRESFDKITDGVVLRLRDPSKFVPEGPITTYIEAKMLEQYFALEKAEADGYAMLKNHLKLFPIWAEFFSQVKGCGPIAAAVLISELNPHKALYPSSFWKFAGYDVFSYEKKGEHGGVETVSEGRSKQEHHMVPREYIDKNGKPAVRKSITFNPRVKTRMYLCAVGMIRQKAEYYDIYVGYKNRLANHPVHALKSAGHRHMMAIRYTGKIFLLDLHLVWRKLEGLPATEPYHVAKLGLRDHNA